MLGHPETIVVSSDRRSTHARQIDATGTSIGPMTYRSGTISADGNKHSSTPSDRLLTFTDDCHVDGDAASPEAAPKNDAACGRP